MAKTSKGKTITQSAFFAGVKPVEIYDALLDGRKHSKMTGGKATGSKVAGGKFTAWDGYISGMNLELMPARRIVQEWQTAEWPKGDPPSRLEWSFEPQDGGTRVTMVHSNVPASQADSYRQGWVDYYWTPMKAYFAREA